MTDERMTDDPRFDGQKRWEHVYRYAVAGRYLDRAWRVVDAACGTGYARRFLPHAKYYGIDKHAGPGVNCVADLETYAATGSYEAWLSFETVEHLHNPGRLVQNAHRATRFCAFSVPIYPGAEHNRYHTRAYTADDLRALVQHPEWRTVHEETQDGRYFLLFQGRA